MPEGHKAPRARAGRGTAFKAVGGLRPGDRSGPCPFTSPAVSLVALGLRVGHCPLRKAPVARRSTQAAAPLPGEARPHPRSPPLVLAAHGSRLRARGSACRRRQVLSPRLPLRGLGLLQATPRFIAVSLEPGQVSAFLHFAVRV